MSEDDFGEQPLFIHRDEFLKRLRKVSPRVLGLVVDLLTYGSGGPFAWSPREISAWLSNKFPRRRVSEGTLCKLKPELLLFFVEVSGNRLAPSHEVFSAIDGNPGSAS